MTESAWWYWFRTIESVSLKQSGRTKILQAVEKEHMAVLHGAITLMLPSLKLVGMACPGK